jgi:hypothetical protein
MKSLALLLLFFVMALVGCSSSPKPRLSKSEARAVNWSERVGSYTYDQAIADLGHPIIAGESEAGRTAEWALRSSPRISFGLGVGGGTYGPGTGIGAGVGSTVSPPPHGENLRLTFSEDGKLKEWTKVKY